MTTRVDRALKRRCDAILQAVIVPAPWDLDTFLRHCADKRGRPIVLDEAPQLANSVSACWWKDEDADLIFYAPTLSMFYLQLNVFHEIGHMLCGHDRRGDDPKMLAVGDMEALTTDAGGAVRRMFARDSRFTQIEEQEAEYIAYRLTLMVEHGRATRAGANADPAAAHMIETMHRTLGGQD